MLSIKPGVTIHGLQPQMVLAVIATHAIYASMGVELVITAGNDGKHMQGSKHYSGNAIDIRTYNLPDPKRNAPEIVRQLQQDLGRDYDVIFEGDHIHIEYDPKHPL